MFIDKNITEAFCTCLARQLCLFGKVSIIYTRTCWAEIRCTACGKIQYTIIYEYLNNNGIIVKLKGHTVLIRVKDIETYVTLCKLKGVYNEQESSKRSKKAFKAKV